VPSETFQIQAGTADVFLRNEVARRGFQRVLLITGQRSFRWFDQSRFVESLSRIASVRRWSNGSPNPKFDDLMQALAYARGHKPDAVIGVGGGSVLDTAKLVAAFAATPSKHTDTCLRADTAPSRSIHLTLVPTTAGSGAEATHFAVLYREGKKRSVTGQALYADTIVLDPELVLSADPLHKAAAGLDAFCQCIESLWSINQTSNAREWALDGLTILAEHLVSFWSGEQPSARAMQWASHLSGKAIDETKTTGPHALSYFLTARYQVPHGIAVGSSIGHFIDHHNQVLNSSSVESVRQLAESMEIINGTLGLRGSEAGRDFFRDLFATLQLKNPEDYWPSTPNERKEWVASANQQRLQNHPTSLPESLSN